MGLAYLHKRLGLPVTHCRHYSGPGTPGRVARPLLGLSLGTQWLGYQLLAYNRVRPPEDLDW